jgi:hypothetical protein
MSLLSFEIGKRPQKNPTLSAMLRSIPITYTLFNPRGVDALTGCPDSVRLGFLTFNGGASRILNLLNGLKSAASLAVQLRRLT